MSIHSFSWKVPWMTAPLLLPNSKSKGVDVLPCIRKSCAPLQGVPCMLGFMLETRCLSCSSLTSNKDPTDPIGTSLSQAYELWAFDPDGLISSPTSIPKGHLSHPSCPVLSKQKHMAPHMASLNSLLSPEVPPSQDPAGIPDKETHISCCYCLLHRMPSGLHITPIPDAHCSSS